jgi:hypothetical protein
MKQAFSYIFNFFNIASPCGDMVISFFKLVTGLMKLIIETHLKIYLKKSKNPIRNWTRGT